MSGTEMSAREDLPTWLIAARDAMNKRLFETRDFELVAGAISRQYISILKVINPAEPFGPYNRRPSKAIVIVGAFRTGKSFLVEHALRRLTAITAGDSAIEPKAISVRCDPHFEAVELAKSLLAAMRFLPPRSMSVIEAMDRVRRRLALVQPTAIHIDEFQRSLAPHRTSKARIPAEQAAICGHVQQLLDHSAWPTPVVLSGTHEITDVLQKEEMGFLRERCSDVIELAPLKAGDKRDQSELNIGFLDYCQTVGLKAEISTTGELIQRLTHAAAYSRGMAFELCREAIEIALWRGAKIVTREDFATFYARKSGVSAPDNPFIASEWHLTDPNKLISGIKSQPVAPQPKARK